MIETQLRQSLDQQQTQIGILRELAEDFGPHIDEFKSISRTAKFEESITCQRLRCHDAGKQPFLYKSEASFASFVLSGPRRQPL